MAPDDITKGRFYASIPSGLLTAVLANHWLDDSAAGDGPARLLSLLGGHFDQVLQSCRSGHRVPESSAFSSALRHLGVTSQQVEDTPTHTHECKSWSGTARSACRSDFRLCGWTQMRKV